MNWEYFDRLALVPERNQISCRKCPANRHLDYDDDPEKDGVQAVMIGYRTVENMVDGEPGSLMRSYCHEHLPLDWSTNDMSIFLDYYLPVAIYMEHIGQGTISEIADYLLRDEDEVRYALKSMHEVGEVEQDNPGATLENIVWTGGGYYDWLDGDGKDILWRNRMESIDECPYCESPIREYAHKQVPAVEELSSGDEGFNAPGGLVFYPCEHRFEYREIEEVA